MLLDTKRNKALSRYKDMLSGDMITEREILTLKAAIQGSRGNLSREERIELYTLSWQEEKRILPEQAKKGLAWLNNLRRTPGGKERKNNPYGWREETILDDFSHFTFQGFYSLSHYGQDIYRNLAPIYHVHGKSAGRFEYVVNGGSIEIIG